MSFLQQTLFRFALSPQAQNTLNEARSAWRGDPALAPLVDHPRVRMWRGTSAFNLLVQPEDVAILDVARQQAPRISAWWFKQGGMPVPFDEHSVKHGIRMHPHSRRLRTYYWMKPVVAKSGQSWDIPDERVREILDRVLISGLCGHAKTLGTPVNKDLLQIEIGAIGDRLPIMEAFQDPAGRVGKALTIRVVEVGINCDLSGYWSAGSLVKLGFGRLYPQTQYSRSLRDADFSRTSPDASEE